jgi:hypothetical protein
MLLYAVLDISTIISYSRNIEVMLPYCGSLIDKANVLDRPI